MTQVVIITLTEAKNHLRVDHDSDDADIQSKVDQAADIVMDYLKLTDIPDQWREGTAFSPPGNGIPGTVKAAALLILGELHNSREAGATNVLSDAVKSLLHRHRDPAMA